MSSDKLNLQFSWTPAQGYGLCSITGIGEFVAVTFAGLVIGTFFLGFLSEFVRRHQAGLQSFLSSP